MGGAIGGDKVTLGHSPGVGAVAVGSALLNLDNVR